MKRLSRRGRFRWSVAGVRLRLLGGLAVLLVAGLVGSSAIGALLLEDFVDQRLVSTLRDTADRVRDVLSEGPQTANDNHLAALLGPPLGIVAVDSAGRVLRTTGSAVRDPQGIADLTATVPAGELVAFLDADGSEDLTAVRIPSPGLTLDRGRGGAVAVDAVILCADTSVDDGTVDTLVRQQALVVVVALLLLIGLAVVVLRLGMRPLARMARTADAIADGSLTRRLPSRGGRSETDQLADAVNNAFDAQARAEATVRAFVADASHELRTPLSTISGWLDLHRQGGLDGAGLEVALEHVEDEVGRMRLLVEELGLLARLDAGRPIEHDAVDLTALADSVVEDAQVIYPDRAITLRGTGPAVVGGDGPKLQQVLRNLVGNAVQHTPDHTAVVVDIVTGVDRVELAVVDNGPGIAAEDLPRVFERFWRAEASRSRAYGGSGLGLAIVQAIVAAHHGSVTVASAVGSGTTVTVSLPRGGPEALVTHADP